MMKREHANFPPVTIELQLDEGERRAVARYYALQGIASDGYVESFARNVVRMALADLLIVQRTAPRPGKTRSSRRVKASPERA